MPHLRGQWWPIDSEMLEHRSIQWWFVCPHTGQFAERMHLPSGAYTFACRKACRLAYRSQRETPRDRALSGAFALRRKLGADGGIGDYVTKPKGMHWRTFERAMERMTGRRTPAKVGLLATLAEVFEATDL
jgi:hypothetical protein